jgi:putative modified peptide
MAGTPLAPELVDKLLQKLGSDNKFRAAFRRDPEAVMIRLGAPVGFEKGKWDCMNTRRLASKEAIRTARAIIRDWHLSLDEQEIQCLEAK